MVPSLPTASLPPRRRGVLPNTRLPLEGTRDTGSGVGSGGISVSAARRSRAMRLTERGTECFPAL